MPHCNTRSKSVREGCLDGFPGMVMTETGPGVMWFVLGGLESLRLSSRGGGEAGAPAEDGPEVPGIHKR